MAGCGRVLRRFSMAASRDPMSWPNLWSARLAITDVDELYRDAALALADNPNILQVQFNNARVVVGKAQRNGHLA